MRRRVMAMGLVAVCCLAACTPGGAETPTPSPEPSTTTPVSSVSPSPTPSPTSERDVAVAAAQEAFVAFWRASDKVSQRGGGDKLPADVVALTVGPQRAASLEEARSLQAGEFRSSGFGRVTALEVVDTGSSSTSPTQITLTACVDQTRVTVTKSGKPYAKRPTYLRITQAQMRRGSSWQVYVYGSQVVPEGFTCANY